MQDLNLNTSPKKRRTYRKSIRINGRRIFQSFTRKADADRWHLEMKVKKERGEFPEAFAEEPAILKDFVSEWLDYRRTLGKPESSLRTEITRFKNYILPRFGHHRLTAILSAEWESFLNQLISREKLAPATRNRIRAMLSCLYEDAIRAGKANNNPIRRIPKAKEPSGRKRALCEEEVIRYLREAQAEPLWFQVFAAVALNTGARLGEVLALQWSDIDLHGRSISISKTYEDATCTVCNRTKGGKERILGINSSLYPVLLDYKAVQKTSFLFWNNERQAHTTPSYVRTIHHRICRKAGIQDCNIHDLRRTYGSHFVMQGGSAYELKELLGHSSVETTKRYAQISPEHLRRRADVVNFSAPKLAANVVSLHRDFEQKENEWCTNGAIPENDQKNLEAKS